LSHPLERQAQILRNQQRARDEVKCDPRGKKYPKAIEVTLSDEFEDDEY